MVGTGQNKHRGRVFIHDKKERWKTILLFFLMTYRRAGFFILYFTEKLIKWLLDEPFVGGMITSPKPRSRVAFEYAQCPNRGGFYKHCGLWGTRPSYLHIRRRSCCGEPRQGRRLCRSSDGGGLSGEWQSVEDELSQMLFSANELQKPFLYAGIAGDSLKILHECFGV